MRPTAHNESQSTCLFTFEGDLQLLHEAEDADSALNWLDTKVTTALVIEIIKII